MPRSKSKSDKFILYTLGDPAGIGPEILIDALNSKKFLYTTHHLIVGDFTIIKKCNKRKKYNLRFKIINDCKNLKFDPGVINVFDVCSGKKIQLGKPDEFTGYLSYKYLKLGAKIIHECSEQLQAIITLPVSKYHIRLAGYKFSGHTEFLQREFNAPRVEMLFLTADFNLLLLTRHIPLKKVPERIKKEDLISRLLFISRCYRRYFKIRPKIALLGLNPHAGERGLIGREEEEIFKPAIEKLKGKIYIRGPFASDGFFRNLKQLNFDLVISCYHDQVLPLLKTVYPDAVNFTIGLPFLRFSPNHGPAFDIAGKCQADSSSLIQCIKYAIELNAG